MRNRYIFVGSDNPERSNNSERSFDTFVRAIMTAIVKKVNKLDEEGTLDILQLYAKLDYPQMHEDYDRLMIWGAYEKVQLVQQLVGQGVLRLDNSSWGEKEMSDEKYADSKPGLEDMCPDSLGYNNYGGPTYSITVSKEGIKMRANFCHQDFGNSWDTIDTSFKWQYRSFFFVPVDEDDNTLKQMLAPFKHWIIYRFSNRVKHDLLRDVINQAADTYLDRFLEK